MSRFFLSAPLTAPQRIELTENIVRHIHVLRLRVSDKIELFNGNGNRYFATLTEITKRTASAEIHAQMPSENESPLHITLIQAISSGERMDFTLQKSVELGVNEIIPITSTRSIVKLNEERASKRRQRWQEIVISACEQSGRNIIPPVRELQTFNQALQNLPKDSTKLLMGLNHAQKLSQISKPQHIIFLVGAEGGWTAQEEAIAQQTGFQAISLGKRVLRTETAALAAIAAMQTLWGDLG